MKKLGYILPATLFGQEVTLVRFGSGNIKMGTGFDDASQQIMIISECSENRNVGDFFEEGKGGENFFENCGQTICLGFNKSKSVDVLIGFLHSLKLELEKQEIKNGNNKI